MKKPLLLALFTCLIFQSFNFQAQIDTAFWFAAPWVSPDNTARHDIIMRISTFGASSTTVHLRQPAATAPNKYDTVMVLGPNQTFNYIFWRDKIASGPTTPNIGFDSLEVRPADAVVPYGIYISSSSNVSAVYDVVTQAPGYTNPETFSLMGRNGLGLEFICPQQTLYRNRTLGNLFNTPTGIIQPKQQIVIVATQSNTTVWITPKCSVVGHTANVTYSVLLTDAGSCYNIENLSQDTYITGNSLSGSAILADKPIAVTVADDSVNSPYSSPAGSGLSNWGGMGCYDLIGDQIVPVTAVGKNYIITRGQLYKQNDLGAGHPGMKESAFIVATQNSTQLTMIAGGATTTATLNKGDTYVDTLFSDISYVYADKTIYVYHVSGVGCELGSALVPPLSCAGSTLLAFSRVQPSKFVLTILCKSGAESSFTLSSSGIISPSSFTSVPGTSALPGGPYYAAQISFNSTTVLPVGSYTLGNTHSEFAAAVFEGNFTSGVLYHYLSSFMNPVSVNAASLAPLCVSSINTVALTGTVSGASQDGIWSSANGTGTFAAYTSSTHIISTTYSFSMADTLKNNLKFYLTSSGSCNPYKDSVVLTINHAPVLMVANSFTLCKNNIAPIVLSGSVSNASGGSWSGGSTGTISPGVQATYTLVPGDLQSSAVIFTLSSQGPLAGCSNKSKNFTVTLIDSALVNAGTDYIICDKLFPGVTLNGTISGNTTTGIWSGPGTGSFLPGAISSTVNYLFSASDLLQTSFVFTLSSLNNGLCKSGVDFIKVLRDTSSITITASLYSICLGESTNLTATGIPTLVWSTGSSSHSITVSPTSTTQYTVSGTTSTTCSYSAASVVQVNSLPAVNASTSSSLICSGDVTILNASGASTYSWNAIPVTTSTLSVSPLVTTVYILKGKNDNSCENSDTLTITVKTLPSVTASASPTLICAGEIATLTAAGALNYSWTSIPAFTETLAVSPASTTMYQLTGADLTNCKNTVGVIVMVAECNGLSLFAELGHFITIYPNPSNGKFTIASEQNLKLVIVNQVGQVVRSMELTSENRHKAEVSELSKGIYFVTGTSGDRRINQKIIIAE